LAFRNATPQVIAHKFAGKPIMVAIHGEPVAVTVSGGAAKLQPGETIEAAIERANQALRQAKSSGKNTVMIADVA
jgi:PleD family two-component response regulator